MKVIHYELCTVDTMKISLPKFFTIFNANIAAKAAVQFRTMTWIIWKLGIVLQKAAANIEARQEKLE